MANMSNPASGGFSFPVELRQRILFVLGAMVVFRLGSFVPVPGVNPAAMLDLMEQQRGTIVDMFNMFAGGALERFSLFALSVMPYISASIIVQLLSNTYPSWQALRKEGESGRRKLTQYTRYGTVALCVVQGMFVASALQQQPGVVINPGPGFVFTAVITLTAGTMFLMWLGEQITERGVGNGISLIIFAGIVAGLPGAIAGTLELASTGALGYLSIVALMLVALAVTAFVVFIERGQRRITVNYARRQGGRKAYMNQSSHLPLKLNMSGVIPAIFASALIMFPATALQFAGQSGETRWLQDVTQMLMPGEPLYMIIFSALIIGFAFFYTALVFNSQETADNLKKSGALIPGIRPGKQTGDYIDGVLTRLTAVGALYLAAVCLVPDFVRAGFNVSFYFGGTSLLIIVIVVMDFTAQVQAHMVSHQYEGLMKKSKIKTVGRPGGIRQG